MNIPTKQEVLAAQSQERELWQKRQQAEAAIYKAAGPELCKALDDARDEWNKVYTIAKYLEAIRSGWFMWPANFDPTWLVNCDGFKPIEKPEAK